MTDLELLELAAKAAGLKEGIGGAFWTEDGGMFDVLIQDMSRDKALAKINEVLK